MKEKTMKDAVAILCAGGPAPGINTVISAGTKIFLQNGHPELGNVETEKVQLIYRNNLHFITKADYREAKKYVKDPEEFDFYKILEWDENAEA